MASSMMTSYIKSSDIGQGIFTKYNRDQNYVTWECAKDLILAAVDECAFGSENRAPFRVAELGANDGGTSIPTMKEIIKRIGENHGAGTPVEIIYEDVPSNDFKSLFMHLAGIIPGLDSFMEKGENVFISAVGRSFYEQCFPDNSINLAISLNSVHFLSKCPCPVPDELFPMLLPVDDPVAIKFAAQANADWEVFLLQRSRELGPGGRLVVVALCQDPNQIDPKMLNFSLRDIQVTISDLWKQMLAEGLITQEEFKSVTYWNYYSSVEQYKLPFSEVNSPVRKAGLRLLSIKTHNTPRVYYDDFPVDEAAKLLTNRMRSFLSWIFLSGLTHRSEGEKEDLLDELFHRVETTLIKTGLNLGSYFHTHILVEKSRCCT